MNSLQSIDWSALEHVRQKFLDGSSSEASYWDSEALLENYDATFARRISWKWEYVLRQLDFFNLDFPTPLTVLDWGCGSGVASEIFTSHFSEYISEIDIFDRSEIAMEYTCSKLQSQFPDIVVRQGITQTQYSVVLISHVLTELSREQVRELCSIIQSATYIIWIEPGSREAAERLVFARELLRNNFSIVLPCPHQSVCQLSKTSSSMHWCHFHAESPEEAFTSRDWARFADSTGIDIRSLPVSFLILSKETISLKTSLPRDRILGHAKTDLQNAYFLACLHTGETKRFKVPKKKFPEAFKQLKKQQIDWLISLDYNSAGTQKSLDGELLSWKMQ